MAVETWLAFVAASIVVLVIPGPTILTVISYSLAHGRRAKLPLVAAVASGDSTALVASLFGVGSLLAASAFWFNAIKWAGGLYLVFLGLTKLVADGRAPLLADAPEPESPWKLFARTYVVTALNPKGIVFYVVFLPQFIDARGDLPVQLAVLAATFVTLAAANATVYAVFASRARGLLASPRALRGFNVVGGSLLCGAGIWALLSRRTT
jgi:threonine/homoserine/homoserine lactone efflux protein